MPALQPWKPLRRIPRVRPPMLARERLNIMSGRNWIRAADKRYDSQLEGVGLGLDVEMGPPSSPGVGTLTYVGEYLDLSGDSFLTSTWDTLNNSRGGKSIGAVAAMLHGYRRNKDILWGLIWGLLGYWQPVAVNGIAAVQGYAKWKHRR